MPTLLNRLRSGLAQNAALMARTDAYDKKVHEACEQELARIERRLAAMQSGRVARDQALATEYTQLVMDRARLARVVARQS